VMLISSPNRDGIRIVRADRHGRRGSDQQAKGDQYGGEYAMRASVHGFLDC